MNALHSYRRDYSYRRNELDGAKSENKRHEAQANLTKIAEDLDQCSEEPKAKFLPRKASPGASNSYYFQSMQSMLYYYLFVHLNFQALVETLDAWS